MTVKELKAIIADMPDDTPVMAYDGYLDRDTDDVDAYLAACDKLCIYVSFAI